MKRFLLGIFLVVTLPAFMSAATVFVWNFDPLDRFYEAEIGDSVDCAYWLERTLNENGHAVHADTNLPQDLSLYDVVFVTTGWFRC